MSIVGIEKSKKKEAKEAREVKKSVNEAFFLKRIDPITIKENRDVQDNYIVLKLVEVSGRIGAVMWNTRCEEGIMNRDVVYADTGFGVDDISTQRVLSGVKTLKSVGDVYLGGMYQVNADNQLVRQDNWTELHRARVMSEVLDKCDNDYTTPVDRDVIEGMRADVCAMVKDGVVRKAKEGSFGYYQVILNELRKDKSQDCTSMAKKWDMWDQTVDIESTQGRELELTK